MKEINNNTQRIRSSAFAANMKALTISCDLVKTYASYKRVSYLFPTIDEYKSILSSYMTSNGVNWSVSRMKEVRLCVLRHIAGVPSDSYHPEKTWVRRQKSSWLIAQFKEMNKILTSKNRSDDDLRVILTLLHITRWFSFSTNADYTTIIEGEDKACNRHLSAFIKSYFPDPLFTKEDIEPYFPHLTTSMGPQGPAILTSLDDLKILPDSLKEDLYYLANDTQGWLAAYFQPTMEYVDLGKKKSNQEPTFRRLHEIEDKEGKKRIIAIFDYWSQSVLKPLHHCLNNVLRSMPEDCTFNQSNFKTILTDPRVQGQTIHSIDLKAATDRVPGSLQACILSAIIGDEEYGAAWLRVMRGYEFACPDGVSRAYAQGQPMGAYSSWPLMALAHHIIIQFAGLLIRKEPIYWVLGDDAVVVGDELYDSYRKVLDVLKIEINTSKTISSKKFFEFAKRYFLNGQEITPFPIGSLIQSQGMLALLAVGMDNAITKSTLSLEGKENARMIRFFAQVSKIVSPEGVTRNWDSQGYALFQNLVTMDLLRWMEHEDRTGHPYGLTLVPLSCSRSNTWYRNKLRYAYCEAQGELAKELYSKSMESYFLIEQHFYEYDGLSQPSLGIEYPETSVWHPLWQVIQKKTNILADIANQQYDISRPVSELRTQWGTYLEEMAFVIPSWDTFDNRKGSAKRAHVTVALNNKLRKFIDKWFSGRV